MDVFRRMIVLDVETTGIDWKKNSIVSIGAVDFNNPKNQFYVECQIWGGAEINEEALRINGFTREEITDCNKPSLEMAIRDFISWTENVEDLTLAGENVWFDNNFMRESAKRYDLEWIFGRRTFDLHSESYSNHLRLKKEIPLNKNRTNLNLDQTLKYVGLPEEPKPHNALTGAKVEAEAFSRLIYGKNFLSEFSKFEVPDYLKK